MNNRSLPENNIGLHAGCDPVQPSVNRRMIINSPTTGLEDD
jgi:hypothetical protein